MGNLARRYGFEVDGGHDPKLKVAAVIRVADKPVVAHRALAEVEERTVVEDRIVKLEGAVSSLYELVLQLSGRVEVLEGRGALVGAPRLERLSGAAERAAKPWEALGISRSAYFAKKKAGVL